MYSTPSTHKPRALGRFLLQLGQHFRRSSAQFRRTGAPSPNNVPGRKDPLQQVKKLADVAENADEVLFQADTVFPFTLFPDTLKVDRQKIMLIHREFFQVSNTQNVQLNDIQSIEADTGPFFGTLQITTQQFENTVLKIHFLTRKDTLMAQQLLQGVVIANQQNIDYANIPTSQLVPLLKKLGRGDTA